MPGEPLPTTYFLLFSFVIVVFMSIVVWLIKRVVTSQDKIADRLNSISINQADTSRSLELITTRLLDALIIPGMRLKEANVQVAVEKKPDPPTPIP